MEILKTLNETLLNKDSNKNNTCLLNVDEYKNRAMIYSRTENAISVLSDMQANKSYVYKSKIAIELGLEMKEDPSVIDSIWEEEILKKIHPDDKLKKYIHELRFFKLLDRMGEEERADYCVVSRIRVKDKNDLYKLVQHRMFYIYSPYNKKLRFALCLYSFSLDQSALLPSDFLIVNTIKGETLIEDKLNYKNILSQRELEVLKCVGEGYTSKEIADLLFISINTVSRHRQNILEKLKVKNSVKAFNESFHM
ncbi:LuxR family transcriptional regulator [Chryseobacterium piperi]|uniref:LuxR family transcriptional regulator n=1 Tax=Chryseobacterium piperi TaxID=558152 RepID=A0A086AJ14_9FLAO|nr:helix-turn-helix transcriptional regulator [Chryseobacterium piperi]ASW73887.1 LuxR family transcriptional regulator [Chryseobacterium piperi]KFF16678.1 LuxR family transcriptional regulator [Chryseobacterium piperi]